MKASKTRHVKFSILIIVALVKLKCIEISLKRRLVNGHMNLRFVKQKSGQYIGKKNEVSVVRCSIQKKLVDGLN